MSFREDPRLEEARALPIGDVAALLGVEGLRRAGSELVGPCPECGGRDRFAISTRKGVFQCRRCGNRGDAIALVRWLRGLSLPDALTWLCGEDRAVPVEEIAARRRRAATARRDADQAAARHRENAIAQARAIWREGMPAEGTAVRDYLALRGISAAMLPRVPACLRYHPALPYMADSGAGWVEVHRGPAMLAVVQQPDGRGAGVHRTWIDPARPRGKALIECGGEALKVKKTWGSVKGGAIRLHTPRAAWDTLVMGEGIETTLSAMIAGAHEGAAFWAGVSLGNIAGRRRQGKGLRYAGLPDLDDTDAFVPPPWVRRLVLIEDGDSDPRLTRASLAAGARRAMAKRPGLVAQVVPCPPGRDLNDLLMEDDADG